VPKFHLIVENRQTWATVSQDKVGELLAGPEGGDCRMLREAVLSKENEDCTVETLPGGPWSLQEGPAMHGCNTEGPAKVGGHHGEASQGLAVPLAQSPAESCVSVFVPPPPPSDCPCPSHLGRAGSPNRGQCGTGPISLHRAAAGLASLGSLFSGTTALHCLDPGPEFLHFTYLILFFWSL
jgi:hypothetical protein